MSLTLHVIEFAQNTAALLPAAPDPGAGDGGGAANPITGPATKIAAMLISAGIIFVAWAGTKVLARSGQGNVKRDMNVGGSVGIGVGLYVVALLLGAIVVWLLGGFQFIGLGDGSAPAGF